MHENDSKGDGLHSKIGKNGMAFVFLHISLLLQQRTCFLAVTTRLSELKPGQAAVIRRLGQHPLSAKLTEMGCLPGEWIRVIRIAPPGDPMSVEILGYQLALRRKEAEVIEVDVRPGFPQHLHQSTQNEQSVAASALESTRHPQNPNDLSSTKTPADSAIPKSKLPLSNEKQEKPNE